MARSRPMLHGQAVIYAVLLVFLALTFVPFVMMLLLSLKTNGDILAHFWALPPSPMFSHYGQAFAAIHGYIWNSVKIAACSTLGILFVASLSGYVFARHRFPFREFLFYLILSLMMVPAILTLIPQFLLVKHLGLLGSHWALILPYISGGQVFGILLCRGFFADIPQDIFDAARMDGAREFQVYVRIVIPLSYPILATIGIMSVFSIYNDFIWPMLVITDNARQVFTVGLLVFAGEARLDMGPALAGYALGSLPLLVAISLGMKYFIRGITSGALKA